jgi:hypothetical protein
MRLVSIIKDVSSFDGSKLCGLFVAEVLLSGGHEAELMPVKIMQIAWFGSDGLH